MKKKKSPELSIDDYRMIEARSLIDELVVTMDAIQICPSFPKIVEALSNCRNKIITTGMGKAGIAMRKFTSTLCSLGFPSAYLHPGEASHGDLGLLSPNDVLFVASTSGKTREVVEIIDLARNLNVQKIIGITSHLDSTIRKKADLVLDMGEIQEIGHLRIAPTSSIIVMLALTDALALVSAKEKGFTSEDYALRHHSGYCGAAARGDKKIH